MCYIVTSIRIILAEIKENPTQNDGSHRVFVISHNKISRGSMASQLFQLFSDLFYYVLRFFIFFMVPALMVVKWLQQLHHHLFVHLKSEAEKSAYILCIAIQLTTRQDFLSHITCHSLAKWSWWQNHHYWLDQFKRHPLRLGIQPAFPEALKHHMEEPCSPILFERKNGANLLGRHPKPDTKITFL